MKDPHKIAEKLEQFAAFLGIPLDLLGPPLPPAVQEQADAIGDQCCADLKAIADWQRERGC